MCNQKTSPQGREEARYTLADLICRSNMTVETVAEGLGINQLIVMDWVCGIVPPTKQVIRLAGLLGCSLETVYEAILNTPKVLQ